MSCPRRLFQHVNHLCVVYIFILFQNLDFRQRFRKVSKGQRGTPTHAYSKRKSPISTLPNCFLLQGFLNCLIRRKIQCELAKCPFLREELISSAIFLLLKIVSTYLLFRHNTNIDFRVFFNSSGLLQCVPDNTKLQKHVSAFAS